MSERKVLNKYYPPDFDPSKIPRMKLPRNRQYTVRLMAPFNMRCATCGEYIYKGKKFNARKEDVENEDYLGIRIYRFYIKCTRCLQEISFKTDPRNTDYEIEAGATRNFMALKLAEEQAQREEDEAREEEANNPMKLLENRTEQSKNEIELLESLEELRDLNKRQQNVDYDSMLQQYDTRETVREREERLQQLDEQYIKTIKFSTSNKRKVVVEEEIIEDAEVIERSEEPINKISKKDINEENPCTSDLVNKPKEKSESDLKKGNIVSWNRSVGVMSRKGPLDLLVKTKKTMQNENSIQEPESSKVQSGKNTVSEKPTQSTSSSLSLLGAYSGSDSE